MEFDFAVIGDNWRFLAYGVWITILLSAVSGFTSLAAGLVIALLRLYGPGWLRVPIVLYIDSMRAIPVLWCWYGPSSHCRSSPAYRCPHSPPRLSA